MCQNVEKNRTPENNVLMMVVEMVILKLLVVIIERTIHLSSNQNSVHILRG